MPRLVGRHQRYFVLVVPVVICRILIVGRYLEGQDGSAASVRQIVFAPCWELRHSRGVRESSWRHRVELSEPSEEQVEPLCRDLAMVEGQVAHAETEAGGHGQGMRAHQRLTGSYAGWERKSEASVSTGF